MSTEPMVSVLTTIYNRESFLTECLESAQKSNLKDFEHILVDDGSTDRSPMIAQEFAAKHANVQFHANPENLGDYPNRNRAAHLAKGKYIKYLDADDRHGKWILDIMVDAMESFPDAGLGLIDYSTDQLSEPIQLSPQEAYRSVYNRSFPIFERSPLGAIIRRTSFTKAGGFSGKRMVGDFELWHTITRQSPLVIIPHNLSCYRRGEDSSETATRFSNPVWPLSYKVVTHNQLEHPDCPLAPSDRAIALHKTKRQAARSIILAAKNHGLSKANEMRGMMNWTWKDTLRSAFKNAQ